MLTRLLTILPPALLLFTACGPAAGAAQKVSEEQVQAALQDVIAWRTQTAEALPSPTPTGTPTITPTPTDTPFPTRTPLPPTVLTDPKEDGVYLVGIEIAIGEWYLRPGEENCYWVRRKYSGIILQDYLGPTGGFMRVRPGDYEVEFSGCGSMQYVGP